MGENVFGQILDQVRTEMRRECAALGSAGSAGSPQQRPVNQQAPTVDPNKQSNQARAPRPASAPPPPPVSTAQHQVRMPSPGITQAQSQSDFDQSSPVATVNYRRGNKKNSYAPRPAVSSTHSSNPYSSQPMPQQMPLAPTMPFPPMQSALIPSYPFSYGFPAPPGQIPMYPGIMPAQQVQSSQQPTTPAPFTHSLQQTPGFDLNLSPCSS